MSLDEDTVRHMARLARLEIAPEDLPQFQQEMTQILALVDQLQAADTDGVPPLAHPIDITAAYRPDQVTETEQREHLQSVAPETEDGLYLVPRVVE